MVNNKKNNLVNKKNNLVNNMANNMFDGIRIIYSDLESNFISRSESSENIKKIIPKSIDPKKYYPTTNLFVYGLSDLLPNQVNSAFSSFGIVTGNSNDVDKFVSKWNLHHKVHNSLKFNDAPVQPYKDQPTYLISLSLSKLFQSIDFRTDSAHYIRNMIRENIECVIPEKFISKMITQFMDLLNSDLVTNSERKKAINQIFKKKRSFFKLAFGIAGYIGIDDMGILSILYNMKKTNPDAKIVFGLIVPNLCFNLDNKKLIRYWDIQITYVGGKSLYVDNVIEHPKVTLQREIFEEWDIKNVNLNCMHWLGSWGRSGFYHIDVSNMYDMCEQSGVASIVLDVVSNMVSVVSDRLQYLPELQYPPGL